MTIPSWPASLPQSLSASSYKESPANLLVSTDMDIGPAKIRRRSSSGPRPVSGAMRMTKPQLLALRSFYVDDLVDGSLRFSWRDPLDASKAAEYRFTDPPEWSADDGGYSVSLSLEILP